MLIIIRKKSFILGVITISLLLFALKVKTLLLTKPAENNLNSKAYIAIIIDDFGNNGNGTEDMLSLDIPFTAAVMPFMPYSTKEAEAAHLAKKDVILHMPMEPVHGKRSWLGPMPITSDLSDEEVKVRVQKGLEEVKWAIGMNNHMGSKIMQDKRIVEDIFTVSQNKALLFIDSKTTEKSVAPELAKQYNIPYFTRDVFLDSTQNQKEIEKRLLQLGKIASKRGYSVGIGHVGSEGGKVTAEAIKAIAPKLQKQGIEFVSISELYEMIPYIAQGNPQEDSTHATLDFIPH